MKRSQLVTAIALSLGVTGWFGPWLASSAQAADCDWPRSASCGCADADRGLLDTLDDLACKALDNRSRRPSILATLKSRLGKNGRCDQPGCGVEPACGAESSCGVEAGCGVEPACGVEPSCGVARGEVRYLQRDITTNHHVSPIIIPPNSSPGSFGTSPHGGHAVPHVQASPVHPQPVAPPYQPGQGHVQPLPAQPAPGSQDGAIPQAQPAVPGYEAIPVPQVQDSITDPFRDDAAMHHRSPGVPAHPATYRMSLPSGAARAAAPGTRQPILHYDPQARSVPARGHISSDSEPEPRSLAASEANTGRLSAQRQSASGAATSASPSSRSSSRTRKAVADVVPASATEPARLPPLEAPARLESDAQASPNGEELRTLRNPLRS